MNKLVQAASFASSPCTRLRDLASAALLLAVGITLSSCKDQAKESAAHAAQNAQDMAALIGRDLGEVERGLPEGAKQLAPLVADGADPQQDVAGVRKALARVRRDVADLGIAKSTFFALADADGIVVRNDLEEDVMAGQNLFTVFPALARARDGYTTTTGVFPNTSTRNGPDRDWIAGVPVKRENGATGAIFVTGWTYRFFARHLQESLKDQLTEQAKKIGDELKMPVFYVAIFDGTGVYSAPLTPPVDEKALTDEDLAGKTAASGVAQGTLIITDRAFGWAATRTPGLASATGVVVLRSEF
jgi:type II secretory pathway pseudopilin PulG